MLRVHTQNTCYEIVVLHDGLAYLSGHPLYCPQPVLVTIAGSTLGRLNAKGALHRSRHAPRVSSSGTSRTHYHLYYPRNPRMSDNRG